jgi:hypothetical protein
MRYLLYIAFIGALFSCKKAEDRTCLKGAGEESVKEVIVPSFDRLDLGPHLKYVLVQDTVEKLVLRGGFNLLNHVETSVSEGLLTISNGNKCNFLRNYKKEIEVEIHFQDIKNVHFEGTKELKCSNTLILNDLSFTIRDGAGRVNLDVNANSLQMLVTHGWGNFDINGNVNFMKLEVRSNGFGNTEGMTVVDSIYVLQSSAENVSINSNNTLLRAEIGGSGDVLYKGTPTQIDLNNYGTGELVDNN